MAHLLDGDLETGKTFLRDLVKATVGFEQHSIETDVPAKSLVRMLEPMEILVRLRFSTSSTLQKLEGIGLQISAVK
jgi:hypothetical protein